MGIWFITDSPTKRSNGMGDKGGKKDKAKDEKQKAHKQDVKETKAKDKQHKPA